MRTRSASSPHQGDFASVLASLEGETRDFFRPVAGVGGLWTKSCGEVYDAATIASAYAEHQPAVAEHRPDIPDFAEIAAEIAAARDAAELHRLRRVMARAAHPDRVPSERRAEAERLMARVNAAIDEALACT
ncbi:hypothetical protein M2323_002491 [Rhodoblastus acidophilus]|uniref:hypothetical protein n=1 Tax=Rhodoblastus acidophilus TaxID=1074 RepID=UPI0022245484|nr:hypothetical protein [Rhodoblastus acidophilus]MCW2284604.1 hypothetical protein [Rhodoblastus acidophilus]MCW2333557.1 hypothetical protein [Rhodoblastus acidophilus]